MTSSEIAGLFFAAAAGGAINAVAGGGTLVTFPALLFFGTPPIIANATSTLALVIGTAGGVFGYRKHIGSVKPWLWRFAPVSLLGGLVGAILLTRTDERLFGKLVPFLILFATILFLAQAPLRRLPHLQRLHTERNSRRALWGAVVFQLAVAVYGGYFGAGIGILMLASLGLIGLEDIHQMNTLKTILGSLINFVAALLFIVAGLIHWPKAGVMTVGALFGYFLGSYSSQQIPQQWVRRIITGIGLALSVVLFYQQFVH
ncbi:MAG TPA: sulfite exporter TauE/SafE family protein [Candidatus Limnocylindrales bacterium]|jgi:uncharacterized membrane protein YfcA|nr:sulfite exporter TauE/SafE family protein [Candidatus Limnocylindrales bacterium]